MSMCGTCYRQSSQSQTASVWRRLGITRTLRRPRPERQRAQHAHRRCAKQQTAHRLRRQGPAVDPGRCRHAEAGRLGFRALEAGQPLGAAGHDLEVHVDTVLLRQPLILPGRKLRIEAHSIVVAPRACIHVSGADALHSLRRVLKRPFSFRMAPGTRHPGYVSESLKVAENY